MKFYRRQSPRRGSTAFVDEIRRRVQAVAAKASGERIRDRATILLALDAQELTSLQRLIAKTTNDLAEIADQLADHGERLSKEHKRRQAKR